MQGHCFCWWDKTYSETVLCQPFNANIFFHVDLQVISRPAPCLSLSPFHKPAKWSCTWPEQEVAAIVLVMQMMTLCQLMTWRWRCSDEFFLDWTVLLGLKNFKPVFTLHYIIIIWITALEVLLTRWPTQIFFLGCQDESNCIEVYEKRAHCSVSSVKMVSAAGFKSYSMQLHIHSPNPIDDTVVSADSCAEQKYEAP